ncbi:unnamed protein product [Parnassius mnemosyne]|uniref:Peptidase S1 domain-containing protein n=1 Tax=Parnassius mnemosyne TaxID=213953 RepID=A0AAV1L635_9NEOP
MKLMFILFVFVTRDVFGQGSWSFVGNPLLHAHPCRNVNDILISYETGLPKGRENVYSVYIDKKLPAFSEIDLKMDTDAIIKFIDPSKGRVNVISPDTFNLRIFNETDSLEFSVKGPISGAVPYIDSLKINAMEYCDKPRKDYLNNFIERKETIVETSAVVEDAAVDDSCGRRKITHTELIVAGANTKAGDWPWHVAIYRLHRADIKYICGGTLLSKNYVLTAAHCATIRGEAVIPDILNVVLGKYNLVGGSIAVQEKEVFKVIVHENFNYKIRLDNDIALLKLRTEVTFTDYVQPACMWTEKAIEKIPTKEIIGTVVGWGFDQSDDLSPELRQATMPIISENACYKSNPLFYTNILTENKFCAGLKNGTSACNGDSGGGFFVFVPDISHDTRPNAPGAWYLKGIVSLTVSRRDVPLCDPTQYVVFTDVSRYTEWIDKKIN